KRLSCQISRVKKSFGKSFSAAAAASALQTLSAEMLAGVGVCDGPVWAARISPVSPAPACARHPLDGQHLDSSATTCYCHDASARAAKGVAARGGLAARGAGSNTTRRNADPARLRISFFPRSHPRAAE